MATPPPFRAVNMVMVSTLSSSLNLNTLYELLTILQVDFQVGGKQEKGSRSKVPFFGVNNAVLSVRFSGKSRGIRTKGGQLRNIVSMDLQFGDKNINLKISELKQQLAGALTQEMGIGAFRMVLEHARMVQEHLLHIRSLPSEQLAASLQYLCERVCGPTITDPVTVQALYAEGQVPVDATAVNGLAKFKEVEATLSSPPEGVDGRTVMYLAMFLHEYKTYQAYQEKIRRILAIDRLIYAKLPTVISSQICISIYNYKIPNAEQYDISLIKLSNGLEKMGYGTSYHNWEKSKSMQVLIPLEGSSAVDPSLLMQEEQGDGDEEEDGEEEICSSPSSKEGKKIEGHRFTIYQKGSIRQSSSSNHEAACLVKDRLLRDIILVLTS